MTVHQTHEFYVHFTIPEIDRDNITELCLNECWDYEMNEGDLTVEGFNSESDAEECEQKVQSILSC